MTAETIGFIGLGAMGLGMTRNLLDAGYAVSGHDVEPGPMEALAAAGGSAAANPALAASGASVLIVCVFSGDQAESVLFGANGAAAALAAGATVVMSTTMPPEQTRAIAARLAESDLLYVDAPITGGKEGADEGTLTVIASGSDAAMATVDGAFRAMGNRVYRVGDAPGAASSVKMINQLLVGVHVVAAAEGIALAARAGADPKMVYEVITHGAGNSNAFQNRIPHILAGDFSPRGLLEIFIKDLGIVSDASRALRFPVPMASAALQQFLAAAAAGYSRSDGGAVVKVYEQLAGIDVAASAAKKD